MTQPISVAIAPGSLAVSADAVWVANSLDDTVSRIDPDTNSVVDTIRVGDGPSEIAVVEGAVWVANEADGTLSRIGARSDVRQTDGDRERPAGARRLGWSTFGSPSSGTDDLASGRNAANGSRSNALSRLTRGSPTTRGRGTVMHLIRGRTCRVRADRRDKRDARARPGHFHPDADRRRSNVRLRVARRYPLLER